MAAAPSEIARRPATTRDIERGACMSTCGTYRYALWRVWDRRRPRITWVMLNPSTACGTMDDPTTRRCIRFSAAWGAGGLTVANLFAARTTDPALLADFDDPVGPLNDIYLRNALAAENMYVVCAWGAQAWVADRAAVVRCLIHTTGKSAYCLGTTKEGHPRHPLYVAASTPLVRFA
jgi:hypothetical protein